MLLCNGSGHRKSNNGQWKKININSCTTAKIEHSADTSFICSNAFNSRCLSFPDKWPCLAMWIMICHVSGAKAEEVWHLSAAELLRREVRVHGWVNKSRLQIKQQMLQLTLLTCPFDALYYNIRYIVSKIFSEHRSQNFVHTRIKEPILSSCSYGGGAY